MNAPTPAAGIGHVRSWTIPLPFTEPLSSNQLRGKHWAVERRMTRPWRDALIVLTRKHRIPRLERFTVVLHYAPRTKRDEQRDLDNLHACLKPIVDGLKKGGGAVDDNAKRYTPTAPVIHPATGEPGRLWLVVIDLSADPT